MKKIKEISRRTRPQDPNDEPASELLKRIKAQKVEHQRHPEVSKKRKKIEIVYSVCYNSIQV